MKKLSIFEPQIEKHHALIRGSIETLKLYSTTTQYANHDAYSRNECNLAERMTDI